jgi:Tfp pilus assembly protein PilF
VLWSQSYDRALSTDDLFDVHADLSATIVGELAQSYGVINLDAAKRLHQSRPASLVAYECVQRAFAYRRKFAKELYPPVRACLEEVVTRDPEYATAWAMLAFAHLDAVRFGFTETGTEAHEMTTGLAAAERAVALAPSSVTALQSLAALRYGNGEFDEAERVQRQAIALNPNDPESLAQLGWRLAVHGRWSEGGTLLQQAIARTVLVPDWYNMTLALALYLDGDFMRARDAAERGKGLCCGLGYATLALTEAALEHSEAARAALDEALRQSPLLARDATKFWGNFQISNDVITRLNAGLAMAGLRLPPSPRGANLD